MPRKAFPTFLLHAGFLLALFGVVGGTNEFYARTFQQAGNAALENFGSGLSVRFQWAEPHRRRDSADTRMLGRRAGDLEHVWQALYSARRRGFWPSATLLALTLALPMSRPRRVFAAVAGVAIFNALFLAEVAAMSALFFRASGAVPGVAPGPWRDFVPVAQAMFNTPITNFATMFLVWAGVAQPGRGIEFGGVVGTLGKLLNPRDVPPPPPDEGVGPGRDPDDPPSA